jgi:hypothetical protein
MASCPRCGKTFRGGLGSHVWACPVTPEEIFWARVDKNGPNGCWLYTFGKDKWGYGDLRYKGKHIQAHRLAWKLLRGDPGKLDCLHTCHNPTCCNPDHLYLGTDLDNTRDRVAIGRQHVEAKLTPEEVQEIRAKYWYESGRSNVVALATKYGVKPVTIVAIISGRSWKHLPHTPIRSRAARAS